MDEGIPKIAWPREGNNKPVVGCNSGACFIENAADFFSGDTTRVVFAVEENDFFHISFQIGLMGFFKLFSSF